MEPPPSGPLENAVRGVADTLGAAVAPVVDQLPQPVQNVADAVGQPVGGLVDVVTNVSGALGQGDIPGAALAALEPAMAPQATMREAAGERAPLANRSSPPGRSPRRPRLPALRAP